tara:strand:- start:251 stop:460 length:210 start_codon:yes stop_codon:yes gene_type:complete
MQMMFAQMLRIDTAAGGRIASNRQFIKHCHKALKPVSRLRGHRTARHAWIRSGIEQRDRMEAKLRMFKL